MLSDEPLIERMQAKLAANGYRFTPLVETDRHQPAVPEQTTPGFRRRTRKVNKMPNRTPKSANRISRRTVLRGAGVTMALPWLESLPAFADTTSPAAFPKRFARAVHGQRRQRGSLERRGLGRRR